MKQEKVSPKKKQPLVHPAPIFINSNSKRISSVSGFLANEEQVNTCIKEENEKVRCYFGNPSLTLCLYYDVRVKRTCTLK